MVLSPDHSNYLEMTQQDQTQDMVWMLMRKKFFLSGAVGCCSPYCRLHGKPEKLANTEERNRNKDGRECGKQDITMSLLKTRVSYF